MPLKNFDALTYPDLILLRGTFVEPGTLPWLLSEHHGLLFPEWLFKGWKGERKVGREAWPAPRLMAMLLLRHSEAGMTRVGAVRKANTDAAWRTALRLPWLYPPPDEKTCREFEAFMKSPHSDVNRPRIELAFEHWARLGIEEGLLGDDPVWVADSTPMWCFGAVLGTVRRTARATGAPLSGHHPTPHVGSNVTGCNLVLTVFRPLAGRGQWGRSRVALAAPRSSLEVV